MGTLAGIDLIRENLSDDRPGARAPRRGEGGTREGRRLTEGGRGELSKKANVAHDEEEEEDSWTGEAEEAAGAERRWSDKLDRGGENGDDDEMSGDGRARLFLPPASASLSSAHQCGCRWFPLEKRRLCMGQ